VEPPEFPLRGVLLLPLATMPMQPAVIIPVLTRHYVMLQRNLLYTGVSRGKKPVVLVGPEEAVAIAVRNVSGRRRWSKLDDWLRLGASRAPLLVASAAS
jgi:exodeoxyribonuclease V alpha subunit